MPVLCQVLQQTQSKQKPKWRSSHSTTVRKIWIMNEVYSCWGTSLEHQWLDLPVWPKANWLTTCMWKERVHQIVTMKKKANYVSINQAVGATYPNKQPPWIKPRQLKKKNCAINAVQDWATLHYMHVTCTLYVRVAKPVCHSNWEDATVTHEFYLPLNCTHRSKGAKLKNSHPRIACTVHKQTKISTSNYKYHMEYMHMEGGAA